MEEIIDDEDGNEASSELPDNLNRRGLSHVPTMSTVFLVHNAYMVHERLKCVAAFILLSCYPL